MTMGYSIITTPMGDKVLCANKAYHSIREHKGRSILSFPRKYVVIDIETTGLDSLIDEIIEISAVRYDNGIEKESFTSLIKPHCEIPQFITELTGITNEMVANAPNIKETTRRFLDFINDDILVGYNVNFDVNFLYDEIEQKHGKYLSNDFIDIMRFAKRLEKDLPNHKLATLAEFYGIQAIHHRSLADCETCNACYGIMKNKIIDQFGGLDDYLEVLLKEKHRTRSVQQDILRAKDIVATTDDFDLDSPFFGKTFVFTGTLERMVRKDAMQIVVNQGGICGDSVTSKTDYLILGNLDYSSSVKEGKSTKMKKAESLILKGESIQILSENVFYDMLEDNKE